MQHHRLTRRLALVAAGLAPAAVAVCLALPAPAGATAAMASSARHPGAHAAAAARADERRLAIDNFTFSPPVITVAAGTTVTWVNHDDIPHTVTAADRAYTSAALDTDDTYSRTFDAPGTYDYYCALHPKMTGQVVVQ